MQYSETEYKPDPPQTEFAPLTITVSRMQMADIPHVSYLERRCYALPWNSSAYATEIGNSIAYYTVAKDRDGIVVGFAGMWVVMDEIHITTLAVDPDVRGKSVGERLLLDMLEAGMERGAHRATLEVREHNLAAHNLYLKYGFEDVAIRKKYYSDNGENAVIMWANDLFSPQYQEMLKQYRARLSSSGYVYGQGEHAAVSHRTP
jgi:ribosomal-protein-alanine N-acetyltransferase